MSFEIQKEWVSGGRDIASGEKRSRAQTGPSAFLGTIAVHFILFLIVVRHFFGSDPVNLPPRGTLQSLVLMDLSGPSPTTSPPVDRRRQPAKPSDPPPSPPDREWQIVQIKTMREASPAGGTPAAQQPTPSAPSGGGYDPYAGAAPSRPGDMVAATSNVSVAPRLRPIADYMVNVFVQGFKIRHPKVRGFASITVSLSPSGRVDRVVEIVGTIDAEGKTAIGQEIVGEIVSSGPARASINIVTIGPLNFG